MSERDLADRAKRGDDAAFEALVHPCLDVAFRTAFVITRDAAEAEDATQSALIRAYVALGRFRSGEPFRPWFLAIVANEAKNAVRSRVRRRTDPLADGLVMRAPEGHEPARQLESLERSAWLVAHINALPDNDRIAIHCRYVLDLSENETASVLGCARGTVKSRLHRAIGRLRTRIDQEDTHEGHNA